MTNSTPERTHTAEEKVSRPAAVALATGSTNQATPPTRILLAHGRVESSGLAWRLLINQTAGNADLRAIAALLITAADRLEIDPNAVDTRITA